MAKSRKSSSRKSRSKKGPTLAHLQQLAKSKGIKYTGLKKSSLITKLRSNKVKLSSKKSRAPCKSGQVRDQSTKRCRKKRSAGKKSASSKKRKSATRKSRAPCKSGQVRDQSTKRCRKKRSAGRKKSDKKSAKKSVKKSVKKSAKKSTKKSAKKLVPCKSGQVRNRSTKRCRNK